jgi:signal transduction histidine kinase
MPNQPMPPSFSFTRGHTSAADGHQDELPNLSPAAHLLLPAAIFVISLATIDFSKQSNLVATVWSANAIMLAALLGHVRSPGNFVSILAGGFAGAALARLLAGNSPPLCATLALADFVEIVIALVLLDLFQITASSLMTFRGMLAFIFIAGGVAPIGPALFGAYSFGAAHGRDWLMVLRSWYPSHALGMIIVVPFLFSVTAKQWQALRIKERPPEAAVILACFVAVSIFAGYIRAGVFIIAPATLFATARLGVLGATASTLVIAITTTVFVGLGIGAPLLSHTELTERLFVLQVFLAITAFWSLPTAALLTERDHLLDDLSHANAQLAADSESKSNLVTGLRRHLSTAEENERLRLSHELHDQAGQSVVAAILELNEIDALTSGPVHERLHLVRKKMEDMGKTLHRIAWELRPPSIDELGLRKALASYIGEWSEQCGTEVDFHCNDANLDDVPGEIATTVYRVVQEGLTNIVKHARRPSDVSVVIRCPDATLQVIIEDNGCGFDVGTQGRKTGGQRGLGLDGMRERLSLIGGTLEVESAIGTGTTIFARITLDGQRSAA